MPADTKLFKVDSETKDITPKARRRLGDYLSSRTLKQDISGEFSPGEYTHSAPRPNTYPMEPSSFLFSSTEEGLANASRNGQTVFVDETSETLGLHRNQYLVDDDNKQFKDTLRNTENPIERDSFVKEINQDSNPLSKELKRQVSGVLKRNRFTIDDTFTETAQLVPIGDLSSGESLPISIETSAYDEMRKHGIRNLLLASGAPLKNLENPDEIKSLQSIAPDPQTLLNGLIRKSMDEFRREGKNDIPEENIPGAGLRGSRKSLNDSTQGQLNNYLEPFGGAFPVSTTLNAAILLTTMTAASVAVASTVGLLVKEIERTDYTNNEFSSLGSSLPKSRKLDLRIQDARGFISNTLGLAIPRSELPSLKPPIINNVPEPEPGLPVIKIPSLPYLENTLSGLTAFIGVNVNEDITPEQILTALSNLVGGAGYYAVIARSIIRNLDTFGNITVDAFSAGQGLVSGIQGTATIIQELKRNKLLRFVDTMARLGIATSQFLDNETTNLILPAQPGNEGSIEQAKRVSSGRRIEGSRELSYSFRSLDNMIPKLVTSTTNVSENRFLKERSTSLLNKAQNKITQEKANQIEEQLDAEYVPFYFKDLRTNEILAFHAFISSLSDSYTANYNDTSAYGRLDPVKTYKDTTRSISFDFMIVSTSPEDFDRMWYSINRLTNMVYPQWSKGEKIVGKGDNNNGTYNFTQPFSQVISSSPLIRVRIGDLIRSNYSRFNLSRIFGLGEDENYGRSAARIASDRSSVRSQVFQINQEANSLERDADNELFSGNLTNEEHKEAIEKIEKSRLSKIASLVIEEDSQDQNDIAARSAINNEFVSEDSKNAIVRSFEDASGKGLAGFITSLSYEWYSDTIQWETSKDSRAPTSCKVSIAFSPIHDIPMGLDHQGAMRAAPYPVGKIVNGIFGTNKKNG